MKTCKACGVEVDAHDEWLEDPHNVEGDLFRVDHPRGNYEAVALYFVEGDCWQIWCGRAWMDIDPIRGRMLLAGGPEEAQAWVRSRYTREGKPK